MNTGSRIFMLVSAIAGVLLLGLPLLLFPLSWARKIGWKLPEQTELANYFGRSAGGAALAISIMGLFAANDPVQYRSVFVLLIIVSILMAAVHAYGMLKKAQPWFENVEVILYGVMAFLAYFFYPSI